MLKVVAYKCQYCGKLYENKNKCEIHEKYDCEKNVNAFNCKDCIYYIVVGKLVRGKCYFNHKISAEQFEVCKDKKFIWDLSGKLPPLEEENE